MWFGRGPGQSKSDIDAAEDRLLERHAYARKVADQTWGEFFRSLLVRIAVIIAIIGVGYLALWLLFGR